MKRYGVYSSKSRDLLTYQGQVIVHDNKAEMEFLIQGEVQIREVPEDWPADQTIWLRFHPDFEGVHWPLTREQFVR